MFTVPRLNEAFDKMVRELEIKPKDICDRSGVSASRLSQFRSGRGGDIGVRSLDDLLVAAQSLDPRAVKVFAEYFGATSLKSIENMTAKEKGELMIALGKSIQSQSSVSTDTETTKTA